MRIALLALPGSMRSALAGMADMFWLANQVILSNPSLNKDISRETPFFDVRIITADGQSSSGIMRGQVAEIEIFRGKLYCGSLCWQLCVGRGGFTRWTDLHHDMVVIPDFR